MLFANTGAGPRTDLASAPDAVWLDLLDPSDAERTDAERAVGFSLPTRAEIAEIESSSRISTENGVLYLNAPVSYRSADGQSSIAPVGFVLSEHRLVTIRFADMPVFDVFSEHFAKSNCACSSEAFAGVIEALVDRAADVMERVAATLDDLSKRTFRGEEPGRRRSTRRADAELRSTLTNVGRCGDTISNLRDTLLGLARIVGYTQQTAASWIPADVKERLATVRQDIASLNDYDQQLSTEDKLPARRRAGVHQHRAEQRREGADRGLGGRHPAHVRRGSVRHELQEHA